MTAEIPLHESSTTTNLITLFSSFYNQVLRLQLLEAEAARQAPSPKLEPHALSRQFNQNFVEDLSEEELGTEKG